MKVEKSPVSCAELSVVVEESGVEKMRSPPRFPLCESKNGVALDEMWPSLPPRSGMQGMTPPPSLPQSGGGWMELFANNKEKDQNPTASVLPVGLAPSSSLQRRISSIKRTQPAKPLLLPPPVQDPVPVSVEEVKLTPSPALVPDLFPVFIQDQPPPPPKVKEQKSKEVVFQNPFSLLADMDMDMEKEDPQSQPPPVVSKPTRSFRKVRFQTGKEVGNPRKRSKSLDKGNLNMSSSFFIAALLCIVPFLLIILTSLKLGVYF